MASNTEQFQSAKSAVGAGKSNATALCALLLDAKKISKEDADRALRLQQEQSQKERIGTLLVKLGLLSEQDIAEAISQQIGVPLVERKNFPEKLAVNEAISLKFLKENKVVLLTEDDDYVMVAMAEPQDHYVLDALRMITGKKIQSCIGIPSEIESVLEHQFKIEKDNNAEASGITKDELYKDDVEHLKELASEAPVIKVVNQLMNRAVEQGASDIHIEPFETSLKIRYRIDGLLREVESPQSNMSDAVVSRIKIMSNLNIAERRLPQDGRFKIRARGQTIDLRVSTIPTMYGESVVMRLLHRDEVALNFAALGINHELENQLLNILNRPHGIILVTGPTGSGKTTTLYAALKYLNKPERKILTVEDPVEYNVDGVNQIQVKPQIGLTFANALRSIVRQDPDVIMIGEMRDRETADIAVQSALTGHLVLSTLHTNDAVGSITRLLDMGVEDYLLTSTVTAVVAQRLVRKLCPDCKQAYEPIDDLLEKWGINSSSSDKTQLFYRAVGCELCGDSGYRGRSAIVELIEMTDPLRQLVLSHTDSVSISRYVADQGIPSMFQDGMNKVVEGITSVEEVLRVTTES